jgi:leucine dehydrogenase
LASIAIRATTDHWGDGELEPFRLLHRLGAPRLLLIHDKAAGLQAAIAIDRLVSGTSMGGIRTFAYHDFEAGIADVARLAQAMSLKCAIAGVPAGGAKCVVFQHDAMDRAAAFRALGREIRSLGGLYRTAGDLGTSAEDLAAVGSQTDFVNMSGPELGDATGETVVNCMAAAAAERGRGLGGLRVAIQGAGLIGAGVAHRLAAAGASLLVADLDEARAAQLSRAVGAAVCAPAEILSADVDVVSPCAAGNVVDMQAAQRMRAWAVCGGANNQLATEDAGRLLAARGILYVPDFLASSGAVISGAALALPSCPPAAQLIAETAVTAQTILRRAATLNRTTTEVATEMAAERLAA